MDRAWRKYFLQHVYKAKILNDDEQGNNFDPNKSSYNNLSSDEEKEHSIISQSVTVRRIKQSDLQKEQRNSQFNELDDIPTSTNENNTVSKRPSVTVRRINRQQNVEEATMQRNLRNSQSLSTFEMHFLNTNVLFPEPSNPKPYEGVSVTKFPKKNDS